VERIVVGFDGSEHSRKALARAADIANGATIYQATLAHHVPPIDIDPGAFKPPVALTPHWRRLFS